MSDDEFVNPDDLQVQRDSDGERLPQTHDAGSFGRVEVLPMAYGDVQEYFGDGQEADVEASEMAELFDRFILRPNLSEHAGGKVTADYVSNMKPLAPRDLLLALLDASGIDADVMVDDEGDATVEVGNT